MVESMAPFEWESLRGAWYGFSSMGSASRGRGGQAPRRERLFGRGLARMKLVVRAAKWIFFHPIFSHQFFCPDRHVFDRNINDRNIAVSRKAAAALNSMRFAVAPLINATLATRMSSASQSNEHRDKLKAAIATSSLFGTQAFSLGYRVWDFQSQLRDCADSGKSTWQAARYLARVKCMSSHSALVFDGRHNGMDDPLDAPSDGRDRIASHHTPRVGAWCSWKSWRLSIGSLPACRRCKGGDRCLCEPAGLARHQRFRKTGVACPRHPR
jgi:hypothetical protein